jgi:hypothetical protein
MNSIASICRVNLMLAFPAKRLMLETDKAIRIDLFRANTPQMRAFHLTWLAFFFCFFAWFGISPLMPIIRKEFQLALDRNVV